MKKKICITLLMVMLCGPSLYASDAGYLWNEAVGSARKGDKDFAFIRFHMLAKTYPDYRRKPAAEFSLGEYYFAHHDLRSAIEEFDGVYAAYPKSREAFLALAYLYKIARAEGREAAAQEYRRTMIALHQVTFIFKDKESLQYLSGFQHAYNVVFYIDKIEVLMDGELFVEVRD